MTRPRILDAGNRMIVTQSHKYTGYSVDIVRAYSHPLLILSAKLVQKFMMLFSTIDNG